MLAKECRTPCGHAYIILFTTEPCVRSAVSAIMNCITSHGPGHAFGHNLSHFLVFCVAFAAAKVAVSNRTR